MKEYKKPSADHALFLCRNGFRLPASFTPPESKWEPLHCSSLVDVKLKTEYFYSPELDMYRMIYLGEVCYIRAPNSGADERKLSLRSAHRIPMRFECGAVE